MSYGQGQAANSLGSPPQGFQSAPNTAPAPRTVASAIGRIGDLNDRLSKVREHINHIADMVGGPRPASAQAMKDASPSAGAVGHLNDAADAAHRYVEEIEDVLQSIHRALG